MEYTLHVHNDSAAVVTGALATDDLTGVVDNATLVTPLNSQLNLSQDGKFLSWSIPTLQPGESAGVSYSVTVNAKNVGENLTNLVTPSSEGECLLPDVSRAQATATDVTQACTVNNPVVAIDMAIVTTHTDPVGQTAIDGSVDSKITFLLKVTNNGPTVGLHDATGVVVDDPMLGKLVLDPTTIVAPDWDISQSTATKLVAKYIGNGGVFVADTTSDITLIATIIPPVAPNGVVPVPGLENNACVAATQPEQNLVNNCSRDSVNVKWIALDPIGACRNGTPFMDYSIPLFDLNANGENPTIALVWWKTGDYTAQDRSVDVNDTAAMLASGAQRVDSIKTPADWKPGDIIKGTVLWPGAVLDSSGNPIDWPGLSLRSDGTWFYDPTAPFYSIRSSAVVEVRITNSVTSTYVPVDGLAIANCHPSIGDALALPDTDPLAHTGMDTNPAPIQWGLFFGFLAIATEMMRRRNRR